MDRLRRLIRFQLILELSKLEERKHAKREERKIVEKENMTDSSGDDSHDLLNSKMDSPKKGKKADSESMTSSPFKASQAKTAKTGKTGATGVTGTSGSSGTFSVATGVTGMTRLTGGITDLLKIPENLPIKAR